MTALLVGYGLLVGALLAAAGWALEGVFRLAGRPVRWVWVSALVLTVVLVALAPLRSVKVPVTDLSRFPVTVIEPLTPAADVVPPRSFSLPFDLQGAVLAATAHVSGPVNGYLALAWAIASMSLLGLFTVVFARFQRARLAWPLADMQGARVRLAPDGGPVVIGLSRSEIVVPRWLLAYGAEEQRLVVAHEQEHIRSRDPILLAVSCVLAVLIPWNPAAWWMLARVRLGVELDCDRRLLLRGIPVRNYGQLLVDLAGRQAGLPLGATALSARTSHLGQRLIAMKGFHSPFSPVRASVLAVFAFVVLAAACATRVPVASVPDSTATSAAPAAPVATAPADTAVPTRNPAPSVRTDPRVERPARSPWDSTPPSVSISARGVPPRAVVIVDGRNLGITTLDSIKGIDPSSIETVEVLKGGAAVAVYGPDAANGVIIITTKNDTRPRRSDLRGIPMDTVVILNGTTLGLEEGRRVLKEAPPNQIVEVRNEGELDRNAVETARGRTTIMISRKQSSLAPSSQLPEPRLFKAEHFAVSLKTGLPCEGCHIILPTPTMSLEEARANGVRPSQGANFGGSIIADLKGRLYGSAGGMWKP